MTNKELLQKIAQERDYIKGQYVGLVGNIHRYLLENIDSSLNYNQDKVQAKLNRVWELGAMYAEVSNLYNKLEEEAYNDKQRNHHG